MAGPLPQDFVSNAKVFADIPGPVGFAGQLLTLKKFDAKEDGSVDVITTVGVTEGAGHREKQGGYKLSLKMVRTQGTKPEVDWEFAKLTKKKLTISSEDEGNGRKISYLYCRVSKVDPETDDQGMCEQDVELSALQRVVEQ